MNYYLGIDIGGTNVEFGILDESFEFIYKNAIKTESILNAEHLSDEIYKICSENFKEKIQGIGIGAPSLNYMTGNIENAPNLNWGETIPICEIFEKKFKVKTKAINDASAAALGELNYGENKNIQNFAIVTLGTGVGIGLVINGKIVHGKNGLGGEFGHVIINRNSNRECNCGNYGCLETYLGKNGILTTVKQEMEFSSGTSLLHKIVPSEISPKDVFKFARKEDPVALSIVEKLSDDLGYALSFLGNTLDLECVILSGGISKEGNFLKKKTLKYFNQYLMPNLQQKIDIKVSELNEINGGIIGAVSLVKD